MGRMTSARRSRPKSWTATSVPSPRPRCNQPRNLRRNTSVQGLNLSVFTLSPRKRSFRSVLFWFSGGFLKYITSGPANGALQRAKRKDRQRGFYEGFFILASKNRWPTPQCAERSGLHAYARSATSSTRAGGNARTRKPWRCGLLHFRICDFARVLEEAYHGKPS